MRMSGFVKAIIEDTPIALSIIAALISYAGSKYTHTPWYQMGLIYTGGHLTGLAVLNIYVIATGSDWTCIAYALGHLGLYWLSLVGIKCINQ
jgi:hypothetical protein